MFSIDDETAWVLKVWEDSEESVEYLAHTYEAASLVYVEDFPQDAGPMWILGGEYDSKLDKYHIKKDVQSRIWITYRKGFTPIGGTGPTTDQGWGCMLRCGQMMLAQALVCRHLGRDWRWNREKPDDNYVRLLKMFLDKKDSCYSIHQIAQMGVSEGKRVGEWYGPNTVAQVLKKLSAFDTWSNIAVHVALDNTVVKEDIRKLCTIPEPATKPPPASQAASRSSHSTPYEYAKGASNAPSVTWKPLVLFIPLRLGLNEINHLYVSRLKHCFKLRQSLGVIGGKPNHAHYFIGVICDELIYLDPHTTQVATDVNEWDHLPDDSYHCSTVSSMKIRDLDPSIALGFYCHTEQDFDDWCQNIHKVILENDLSPMFELTEERPNHWPPFETPNLETSFEITEEYDYPGEDEVRHDSDDDFEVI